MRIIFKKLTAKNFMSVGNTPIVVDFTKSKKTLIIGGNGAGKTTIPTALTYALFGRGYSKINLPSLINSINNKESIVTLEFSIGPDEYKIERGQKPKVFNIYKNGTLIKQDSLSSDYQEYLETAILKCNFSAYSQIMYLGSSGYTPFLQLKAADRRAFTEHMLTIAVFSVMNKIIKTKVSDSNNKIFKLEAIKGASEKAINVYEEVISEINKNYDATVQDYTDKLARKAAEYKTQSGIVNDLIEKQKLVIHDEQLLQTTQTNIRKCQSLIANKKAEAETIRKSIKNLNDKSVCDECMQPIDEAHRNKHLTKYNAELDALGDIIIRVEEKLAEFEVQQEQLLGIKQTYQDLSAQIKTESSKLEWMKSDALSTYNEKKKYEDSRADSNLDDKTAQLTKEKETLQGVEKDMQSELTLKRIRDIMVTSLKDTGAKAEIVKQYIPIITALANQYMQKLGVFAKFELDENFNETLKSRHRDEFSYESFSMGERTRINIALLFTWRDIVKNRTGITTNLLFFDEILEVLDMEGFDVLLSIIDQEEGTNCFVISHKTGLDQMFDDIIEVKKVKGFTELTNIK